MGADLMVTAVVVILTTIIILLVMKFRAVSSIVPSPDNSGASPVPPNTSSSSSGQSSRKYDVFLSFRGEDTRKTFVDHLYYALVERTICTYKDDVTLARGDTIGPSLLKAIQESRIALIVFSKNYANSSWCLDELAYIMKCKNDRGKIVIPIFYHVDPSDVRKLKGEFGKAFSKLINKSTNNEKVQAWRTALVGASNIAGWETKFVANGHEAKCIKEIVGSVLDTLLSFNPVFENEKLVGMGTRLHDLESQLEIGSGGARMVGIWGVGGGGKTTLANSLFKKISGNFDGCCFVGNIREESSQHNGLKNLQNKILFKVLKTQVEVESVDIGKDIIKSRLCSRNVLIVLDDVDDVEQLEALAGSRKWFGDGSRIIITTRNVHVLISHGVDVVSSIRLLSHDEAILLFRRYAYLEDNPVEDYDELSLHVISYVKGLPLALKIIGSFLKGKNKIEWNSALEKLKDFPNRKVTEILKISYDGLDLDERELFLDIACFFRGESKEKAMEILGACGFYFDIGVKVLIEKSLITISYDGKFDVHDLIQEMGHHIVREEHPNNPEKHSRVWRSKEISDMCSGNATMENYKIEAIRYHDIDLPKQGFMTLVSNLKKLRFLDVITNSGTVSSFDEGPNFLSNELKYIKWCWYPPSLFPESFQPRKLVILKLQDSLQKELWKGYKDMPCLKQLELTCSNSLVRTPDIGGLSCLLKLIIKHCKSLKEIHQSLGNHASLVYVSVSHCENLTRFPSIVRMEKLEILEISVCKALIEFPKIEANMDRLVNLHLYRVAIEVLPSSVGRYCTNLISLKLELCLKLKSIEGNFHALEHLQKFKIAGCTKLEKLPKDMFAEECCLEELCFNLTTSNTLRAGPSQLPRLLRKLNLSGLKDGEVPREICLLSNLRELHLFHNDFTRLDFSLISQLARLKLLNLDGCYNLVELPELPSSLSILIADDCHSLEAIRDDVHRNCKWLCQVSITRTFDEGCRSLVGGDRLLESMLQGMGHQCMRLHLKGIEIPKGFEPRLVRGRSCRLKLPKNWFNEFAGFLFCCVYMDELSKGLLDSVNITMERNGGMDSQQQVFWEENETDPRLLDKIQTWVGYVPLESLRHTAWWDQTSTTSVDVSIDFSGWGISMCGFGVRLVSNNKNQMKETTKNFPSDFSDDDYKCIFNIRHDSRSLLVCQFQIETVFKPVAD